MLHLLLHWVYLKELSILIKITEKNVKMDSCVRSVNSKFELSTLIAFSFSDAFKDEYLRNKSATYWTYGLAEYI